MRRKILFIAISCTAIFILVVALIKGWFGIRPFFQLLPRDTFGFIIAILIIAVITWILRGLVESDPDPFFLNLTFFAFAGQCIRVSEVIRDGSFDGFLALLLLFAFLVALVQVVVMKAQMRITLHHYKTILMKYKTDGCSESEIEHWADTLLEISGVDFSPGLYRWLAGLAIAFTEPREKSRKDAFSILPKSHFKVAGDSEFNPTSLIVPPADRQWLWYSYLGTCFVAWGIFIFATVLSTGKR